MIPRTRIIQAAVTNAEWNTLMENLSHARCEITVLPKKLWQRYRIRKMLSKVIPLRWNLRRVRPQSGEKRYPAGMAEWILAIRAVETDAPRGKAVDVGSLYLWMSIAAEVGVQVVYCDEQDVRFAGLWSCRCTRGRGTKKQCSEEENGALGHAPTFKLGPPDTQGERGSVRGRVCSPSCQRLFPFIALQSALSLSRDERLILSHMRAFRPLLAVLCLLLHMAAAAAAENVAIAAQGRPLQPVVISPRTGAPTKAVAQELAAYLTRITGAEFQVETGDGHRGIVLGTLAEFPTPSLDEPLAIRNTFDGKEAFAIRTERERILLIGATEVGASHAAFRLLEHLGCRWFFPAREWEVIPQQRDLTVSLSETDRPRILARRIWYGHGLFDKDAQEAYDAWTRRNRMASSLRVRAGHAWQSIIADNKPVFKEHPDYLALVKGRRQ